MEGDDEGTIGMLLLQYIPLMAEGILLFAGDNVWSQELDRKKKYWVHGVLLFVGTVFLTAGIVLEIDIKGNRRHFTSNHGLTGKVRHLCFFEN